MTPISCYRKRTEEYTLQVKLTFDKGWSLIRVTATHHTGHFDNNEFPLKQIVIDLSPEGIRMLPLVLQKVSGINCAGYGNTLTLKPLDEQESQRMENDKDWMPAFEGPTGTEGPLSPQESPGFVTTAFEGPTSTEGPLSPQKPPGFETIVFEGPTDTEGPISPQEPTGFETTVSEGPPGFQGPPQDIYNNIQNTTRRSPRLKEKNSGPYENAIDKARRVLGYSAAPVASTPKKKKIAAKIEPSYLQSLGAISNEQAQVVILTAGIELEDNLQKKIDEIMQGNQTGNKDEQVDQDNGQDEEGTADKETRGNTQGMEGEQAHMMATEATN